MLKLIYKLIKSIGKTESREYSFEYNLNYGCPLVDGALQYGYLLLSHGWAKNKKFLERGRRIKIVGIDKAYRISKEIVTSSRGNTIINLIDPILPKHGIVADGAAVIVLGY